MARNNFTYQNPVEAIGASLGKALFGDPGAAAAQAKARTEAELTAARTQQALSSAGYDDSRTTGQGFQNSSAASLPGLIAGMTHSVAPPAVDPMDAPSYPGAAPARANLRGAGMGSVIAALAGQQGDKVDVGQAVGAITAMLGNDGDARRGLVAQGHTPGKDFALTAERADQIGAIENASELAKAIGVASINNRDDLPVATIQATTQRRGQDIGSTDRRRGQDISAASRREAAATRAPRAASKAAQTNPISVSAYQIMFGNLDDDLGELGDQGRAG